MVDAKVVGCTLSKAAIAEEIINRRFDAVIVDEASMASIPSCYYAAGLAKKRVAIFGDFRQLAPICQAEETDSAAQHWLSRDLFEEAGISRPDVRVESLPPHVRPLRKQYRMHPDISSLVNAFAYDGLLIDGVRPDQHDHIRNSSPGSGRSTMVVDTWQIEPLCHIEKGKDRGSHFSPSSAAVSACIVKQAPDTVSVAVVTPYAAQSRLINAMLAGHGNPDVTVATVHRFQGGESDVVIVDLTDYCPTNLGPPLFSESSLRLLNVALSRARGKLIIIGDTEYLAGRSSKQKALGQLLDLLSPDEVGPYEMWSTSHVDSSGAFGWYSSRTAAQEVLLEDLVSASEDIVIRYAKADLPVSAIPLEAVRAAERNGACVQFQSDDRKLRTEWEREFPYADTTWCSRPYESVIMVDHEVAWLFGGPRLKDHRALRKERCWTRIQGKRAAAVLRSLYDL